MSKLNNFPKVRYLNLDDRVDRKDYMERQFDHWNIDYERISASEYTSENISEWKHFFIGHEYFKESYLKKRSNSICNALSHIRMVQNWYYKTNEPYLLMMEDDYDLNLIEYWNFDWDTLMSNIPIDHDCIQIGYESRDFIRFFLYPKPSHGTYFGPCLITRNYAKKLIDVYTDEEKVQLIMKSKDCDHMGYNFNLLSIDYFMCSSGKTYCIPLIPQNPHIDSSITWRNENDGKKLEKICHKIYYDWWTKESSKFSIKDMFAYNKPYDNIMTVPVIV
jgi:hypothetical protein